jgi:hypothetical protein
MDTGLRMSRGVIGDSSSEFLNLSEGETGVPGTIRLESWAERDDQVVFWCPGRFRHDAGHLSVSIQKRPALIRNGLKDGEWEASLDTLLRWVSLNRRALQGFSASGVDWSRGDVRKFAKSLQKISQQPTT